MVTAGNRARISRPQSRFPAAIFVAVIVPENTIGRTRRIRLLIRLKIIVPDQASTHV